MPDNLFYLFLFLILIFCFVCLIITSGLPFQLHVFGVQCSEDLLKHLTSGQDFLPYCDVALPPLLWAHCHRIERTIVPPSCRAQCHWTEGSTTFKPFLTLPTVDE